MQERGLSPEDWGGATIVCPVSPTNGTESTICLVIALQKAESWNLRGLAYCYHPASPPARPLPCQKKEKATQPPKDMIEAQVATGRGPTAPS